MLVFPDKSHDYKKNSLILTHPREKKRRSLSRASRSCQRGIGGVLRKQFGARAAFFFVRVTRKCAVFDFKWPRGGPAVTKNLEIKRGNFFIFRQTDGFAELRGPRCVFHNFLEGHFFKFPLFFKRSFSCRLLKMATTAHGPVGP